jgi:2-succinyl-6-hydroxy-2,4-cyclohexadiene-1-carboxylate synthase
MEPFSFAKFCAHILEDESLGARTFYKDQNQHYSYKELLQSVIGQIENFKSAKDKFSALKMESSYNLFVHLLAGSFAQTDLLIISSKEPEAAVAGYQKNIPFTNVITDHDLKSSANSTLPLEVDMNRPAFFILSSGSSGPSKAIGLSLNNVYHSAKSIINFFEMESTDTTFLNLPHHHIGGLMILWRAFFSHSSVTKNEEDEYQFISLVPLQLQRFLQIPEKKKKLVNCRGVLIGGAPLDNGLKDLAINANISIYETYGMSETSSLVMLNGLPLEGQTVKLDSENNFLIKGPTLSPNAPVDSEGFFHTKDMGAVDANGFFSFKQRRDILYKSAGELIDPLLIEDKVKLLPWITMAVVVPIAHPEWTWASALVYQTNDSTKSFENIKTHLRNELHPHLIPKYFYEAPKDLVADGMKPKRFEISQWAQVKYFQDQLHYLYIPANNAKKLMVFFHGFMEDHTDMIPLMDSHQDISYLFIDLPGHGKTNVTTFKSREQAFSTIASLINFLKKDLELVLYGYSMGGRIALELSIQYLKPDLLILESSHFGLADTEAKSARYSSDLKLLATPNLNLLEFFTNWYKNPIFSNYNQSHNYHTDIEKKLAHNPSQWQSSLEFFSPGATPFMQSDVLAKVADLKIVGIAGSEDEKYKNHFLEMKTKLPNFQYKEIPTAGHNPHKTHLSEIKMILRSLI